MTEEDIKTLIREMNMLQYQFAEFVGISTESLSRVLKGKRSVPELWVYKINEKIGKQKVKNLLTTGK